MNKNKIYLESDINLNKFKSVTLKQYNKDSQWLVINVTENGKPFIFGENDICIFKMKTPDGREIYNDAVIADNTVIAEVTENCCTCSGTGKAELNIIDEESGSQIATMNFYVTIEASVFDNRTIVGSTEYGALVDRIAKADAVIAKTNEIIDNTTAAAEVAADSAAAAKASEENAKESEENAKASEMNAQSKMTAAENSANAAALSAEQSIDNANYSASQAQAAYLSAEEAGNYVSEASGHEGMAKEYSNVSFEYRVLAESYAKGGTHSRENEDVDNAKYYYEQARGISEGLQGSLLPMGTITFSQLENSAKQSGYMYNISNEFITDSTFKEGAGYTYPAGTNVYYTADGYWDCLAGTQVTGVKGNAENSYRKGNVNITPANIGLGNVENKSTADLMNLIYPIGSIYMSVNNINPSTLFGGTWVAWGNGRVPVGVNASDTDFATAEKTGGDKNVTYTPVGTVEEHALTTSELPAHSHGVGEHSHGLNNHTHVIPALSGTAASSGAHVHSGKYDADSASGTNRNRFNASGANTATNFTASAGAHTHTVTTNASTTGPASGSTQNSSAFRSELTGSNSAHTHGFTGTAGSINTVQPYITCYMWKRTA